MEVDKFVWKIREKIHEKLQAHPRWGRNNVMIQVDIAIAEISLEALKNKVEIGK